MAQVIESNEKQLFLSNGCLHRGAELIKDAELRKVETPPPSGRHYPTPHHRLFDTAREMLEVGGFQVKQFEHSITPDGNRYFGLMEVTNGHNAEDYSRIVGLRNAHDKKFTGELVTGAGVFVCDNLSFSGEIKVSRKHTRFMERDLPKMIGLAIGKISEMWDNQGQRIEAYKDAEMSRAEIHDMVCLALNSGALPSSKIKPVLDEYRAPQHEEFEPRTAWSFFNAFTEIGKAWPLPTLQRRTTLMHGVVDTHLGIDASKVTIDTETLAVETADADVIVELAE